jgi:hypothetical protein
MRRPANDNSRRAVADFRRDMDALVHLARNVHRKSRSVVRSAEYVKERSTPRR